QHLPIATGIAERILCLPIFPDLTEEDQRRVVDAIRAQAALGFAEKVA
ncbi:DegT/DnrJ/EryC1/StrS family aminotransferase, partial [Cronobacter sakazakii]